MQPKSYLCYFCSKQACFGIGYGGFYDQIPHNRRGYLWVCRDHKDQAIERRDLAKEQDIGLRKKA